MSSSGEVNTKRIRTTADLAIQGAEPAFSEPIHVGRPNLGSREDFLQRVNSILDDRWLTNNGPRVQELERRLEEFLQVRHCVAMCNGTIALEIAIRSLELTGEVILPSYTFIATAHALHWQEITPIFADIDPLTHNLDPASVAKLITPRTSAIIGVHLWGRAAPHEELQSLADQHGLKLLYDAAHAFGCTYRGTTIGNLGSCEVLSFHATKSFHTFEGGAVVTNDDDLATRLRLMRNFGFATYDEVVFPGVNGKMPEICAAMGLTNLAAFDHIVESNRSHYNEYVEALSGTDGVRVLPLGETESSNYHYVVVEIDENFPVRRDVVVEALHAENILARRYFWPGCHGMPVYRALFPQAYLSLPNTIRVAERVVVLPTGTTLPEGTIRLIGEVFAALASG